MTRAEFRKAGGVIRIQQENYMRLWHGEAEAPRGYFFKDTGTHFVCAESADRPEVVASLLLDIKGGIEPCPPDCECEHAMLGDPGCPV